MKLNVEYTDTFADEPNYSWVRRAEFEAPDGITPRVAVYLAQEKLKLLGISGDIDVHQDNTVEWRPYGMCTVMFITWDHS